ncbi:MAG: hypothetical protein R3B06_04365 [Kofleriaceae bacterium]
MSLRRLWVAVVVAMVACGGKHEEPAKAAAPVVPATAAAPRDAAPPPPSVDAGPLARITDRRGPWSIVATQVTTTDRLARAGFQVTSDWESSRAPAFAGTLVDTDDDPDIGVVAFIARDGDRAGQIAWLETATSANADAERGAPFAAAGLCVEGVCPGGSAASADKLGLASCETHRVEMVFRYKCPVAGAPLAVIFEGDVPGARANRATAFATIKRAGLAIHALAWEATPSSWQPMIGCTTDCD